VARANDVNANQLFAWRKRYREGELELSAEKPSMLPVRLQTGIIATSAAKPLAAKSGLIDIDLGHARVRIEGAADPACVKAALEGLLR
jgi:transposase